MALSAGATGNRETLISMHVASFLLNQSRRPPVGPLRLCLGKILLQKGAGSGCWEFRSPLRDRFRRGADRRWAQAVSLQCRLGVAGGVRALDEKLLNQSGAPWSCRSPPPITVVRLIMPTERTICSRGGTDVAAYRRFTPSPDRRLPVVVSDLRLQPQPEPSAAERQLEADGLVTGKSPRDCRPVSTTRCPG